MSHILPQAREGASKSLTREELYELVWTSPTVQVAKSLGVSDVAIAKICKRLNIPKPPLGYWAKVQYGEKLSRPPLPTTAPGLPERILIGNRPFEPNKVPDVKRTSLKQTLKIPEDVQLTHPLIRKTLSALKGREPDKYGRISPPRQEGCLDVLVGKDKVQDAMRVMQILIGNLENMGHSVRVANESEYAWKTTATIESTSVGFKLEEPSTRSKRTTPPKERWDTNPWVYTPSGRLVLAINDYADGIQRQWRVAADRSLEETLSSFMSALIATARAIKAREAMWERERLEREGALQRQQAETERVQQLKLLAQQYSENQKIRDFLKALKNQLIKDLAAPDDHIERWIAWAEDYANKSDPIQGIIQGQKKKSSGESL